MNRDRFLTAHGMNAAAWRLRHGLEEFVVPCADCGAQLTTSIPIACAGLRGLKAVRVRQSRHALLFCAQVKTISASSAILTES